MKELAKKYLELLETKFKGLNLTRITSFEEFYGKQIVDSLMPVEHLENFQRAMEESDLYVDVGFGGGFPILPMAKQFPEHQFIGFEARRKKSDAVNEIAKDLGLDNVHTFHKRIEGINFDIDSLISFKAVGKVKDCLNLINPSENDIYVLFFKGPQFDELEHFSPKQVKRNWELIERKDIELEGTDGRILLLFKNVPRRTTGRKNSSQLVNLSEIL